MDRFNCLNSCSVCACSCRRGGQQRGGGQSDRVSGGTGGSEVHHGGEGPGVRPPVPPLIREQRLHGPRVATNPRVGEQSM